MDKAIILTSVLFAWAFYKWAKYYKQKQMAKRFQDKVVWITGASSGLGRGIILITLLNSIGYSIISIGCYISTFC